MNENEQEHSISSSAIGMPPSQKTETNSQESRTLRTRIYESIVEFVAELIADVLTHPKLFDHMVNMIVAAINAFMDQDDIGTKIDKTARNVIYDPLKARQTSKALGKEVVPMVTGFVGGVASSLTPSAMKRRKKKRVEFKKNPSTAVSTMSEITLSGRLEFQESGSEEDENDENDDGEDGHHSNWFSSSKKMK